MTALDDAAAAVHALAAALRAAANDPADGVRLLAALAAAAGTGPTGPASPAFPISEGDPSPEGGGTPKGVPRGDRRHSATMALCRRAAVIEACRASTGYRPTSYDDAAGLRARLCALLDAEITAAGDAGEDDVFRTLRALRAAVVQDLTARGATLAPLVTVERRRALPALTLAQDLYGDAERADELVERADPAHPLFMPPSFEALAR